MNVISSEFRREDQRSEPRAQTVYLPCCLRAAQQCRLGLIRNLSPGGLMVETELAAEPGSELEYFQDTALWRRARVIWREGGRLGLAHLGEPAEECSAYPPRAIRIPTSLLGRVWLAGKAVEVGIGNISHKGVLAFGVPPIELGRLVTLSLAGQEFAQTSLRWWADGSAGLRFAQPLSVRALTDLVDRAGRTASGLYHERRLAALLEVVPANDVRG
jgi:hypothetical protein